MKDDKNKNEQNKEPIAPSEGIRSAAARGQAPAARGDGPAGRGPKMEYLELSPSLHLSRLIARIDEEAHRFAVTYHSLLKRKSMLT